MILLPRLQLHSSIEKTTQICIKGAFQNKMQMVILLFLYSDYYNNDDQMSPNQRWKACELCAGD